MQWVLTAGTAAALLLLFAFSQYLRSAGIPAKNTRQMVHIVGACTAALFPLYLHLNNVIALSGSMTVILGWTYFRGSLQSVHAVERQSAGAVLFPLGLGVAALITFSHPWAFAFGALVLALADPSAATVGQRLGGPGWKVRGSTKTLSGALACATVSVVLALLMTLAFGEVRPVAAVVIGIIVAVTEGSLGYGLDNLPIPVFAATLGVALLGF